MASETCGDVAAGFRINSKTDTERFERSTEERLSADPSSAQSKGRAAISTDTLLVPVAAGELIDKITILEIKSERIADTGKLRNVRAELTQLSGVRDAHVPSTPAMSELAAQLKAVNEALWDIEDEIRDHERQRDFGPRFIELARAVYHNNDQRSRVKREINELCGSSIVEEKSYAPY